MRDERGADVLRRGETKRIADLEELELEVEVLGARRERVAHDDERHCAAAQRAGDARLFALALTLREAEELTPRNELLDAEHLKAKVLDPEARGGFVDAEPTLQHHAGRLDVRVRHELPRRGANPDRGLARVRAQRAREEPRERLGAPRSRAERHVLEPERGVGVEAPQRAVEDQVDAPHPGVVAHAL